MVLYKYYTTLSQFHKDYSIQFKTLQITGVLHTVHKTIGTHVQNYKKRSLCIWLLC